MKKYIILLAASFIVCLSNNTYAECWEIVNKKGEIKKAHSLRFGKSGDSWGKTWGGRFDCETERGKNAFIREKIEKIQIDDNRGKKYAVGIIELRVGKTIVFGIINPSDRWVHYENDIGTVNISFQNIKTIRRCD